MTSVRTEVIEEVVVVHLLDDLLEVALAVDPQRVGLAAVVAGRQHGTEPIAVVTEGDLLPRAPRIGRRLHRGHVGDRAGLGPRRIGDVVAALGVVPVEHERRRDLPGRDLALAIEGLVEVVLEPELDHRAAVGGDGQADQGEVEPRPDVLDLLRGQVELRLVRREGRRRLGAHEALRRAHDTV